MPLSTTWHSMPLWNLPGGLAFHRRGAPFACAAVFSADGAACADGFVHFVNEFGETILSQQVRARARAAASHVPAQVVMSYVVRQEPFFVLHSVGGSGDAARGSHVAGSVYCSGACDPRGRLPELAPRLPVRRGRGPQSGGLLFCFPLVPL